MTTEYKLEGRLRPNYEFYVGAFGLVLSIIVWNIAPFLNINQFWQYLIVSGFLSISLLRVKAGFSNYRYQQSLNYVEPFKISTDRIPSKDDATWLGRGFVWTSVHSQRMYDAKKANLKRFYQVSRAFVLARHIEMKVATNDANALLVRIAKFTSSERWWVFKSPIAPISPVGGVAALHAVGVQGESDQYITVEERVGNLIVFGQSRVGKTRLLEVLLVGDIARNDGPVFVFDPKNDVELLARMWAEARRNGRETEFYMYSLAMPELSAKYNSIANFARLTSVAARISDEMSGGGDSQVFRDFAFRFLLVVASVLVEMGDKPNIAMVRRYIEDLEALFLRYARFTLDKVNPYWREEFSEAMRPTFKQNARGDMVEVKTRAGVLAGRSQETIVLDKMLTDFYERNPTQINETMESMRSALRNDQSYYSKITASLIPLLSKLTSGRAAELISPDYSNIEDNRPIFSWEKAIQRDAVVYVGFDAMTDNAVASANGGQFFSDFISSVAGRTYKFGTNHGLPGAKINERKKIWIHMDEFQSLIGSDSILSILNRAAGAGSILTAYSQTKSDIEEAFGGDKAKANVVLGNFNSVIMFRVAQKETAEYLTDKIGSCDLYGMQVQGSVKDTGKMFKDDVIEQKSEKLFSTSFSAGVSVEANEPLISPATIMSLPKGQAFGYLNGERLVKLRFPLLVDAKGYEVGSAEQVYSDIKEMYHL
ncbi:conjugative transfer system coupling protein TraD [Vibrio sp. PNB22_3_1]